jgi:hypothetical protein
MVNLGQQLENLANNTNDQPLVKAWSNMVKPKSNPYSSPLTSMAILELLPRSPIFT